MSAPTIVNEVVESYNVNHQISLVSARLESMAFRYSGATSAEELSEYMDDNDADRVAAFIADSQAELESLRQSAEKMRPHFLLPEEQLVLTDQALRSLSPDEQLSLSYVIPYEENLQSLYWRLYRIANKTR